MSSMSFKLCATEIKRKPIQAMTMMPGAGYSHVLNPENNQKQRSPDYMLVWGLHGTCAAHIDKTVRILQDVLKVQYLSNAQHMTRLK